MSLARLVITSVRNVRHADFALAPGLNVLLGPNGSGKSSVLEAMCLLSQGKSFRAGGGAKQLISFGEKELLVSANLSLSNSAHQIGFSLSSTDRHRRVDGRPSERQSELAALLPVVMLQPSAQILLESAPELRRQYMDWGTFQCLGMTFLAGWRRYSKCLEQRNALLKGRGTAGLAAWETELVAYGNQLALARDTYLTRLAPFLDDAMQRLAAGLGQLKIFYDRGWPEGLDLQEVIVQSRDKDRRLGYTSVGPHRADFRMSVEGVPVRQVLSRGQLKLAVAALKIAQARLAQADADAPSGNVCLLVDDLAAELDAANRQIFFDYLNEARLQTLVTGTGADQFDSIRADSEASMFHVEHGVVTPA